MSDTRETQARAAFEAWITAPPFERSAARRSHDPAESAWPGQYVFYDVQLAWEAWQAALDRQAEEREALWKVARAAVRMRGEKSIHLRSMIRKLPKALAARLAADTGGGGG